MSTKQINAKESKGVTPLTHPDFLFDEHQLGVWKIIIAKKIFVNQFQFWTEAKKSYPFFFRLVTEIYTTEPRLLYFVLQSKVWYGINVALEMHLHNILLTHIEQAIFTGKANKWGIFIALAARFLYAVIDSYVQWSDETIQPVLKSTIQRHFHLQLMQRKLAMDMPTSKETSEYEESPDTAWQSIETIFNFFQLVMEISSQLLLLIEVSRTQGGNVLVLLCIPQVIAYMFVYRELWKQAFFAYINNEDYKRAQSLEQFSDGSFRQDIISNSLGGWIMDQYQKAYKSLRNIPDEDIWSLYSRRDSPLFSIFAHLLGDLPMVYFAMIVIKYPQHASIAAASTFQSSVRWLCSHFNRFSSNIEDMRKGMNSLKKLYEPKVSNIMKDGTLAYPRLTEKEDNNGSNGMSFELKAVSFAYPGSESTDALKRITLSIKAGHLVAIVGGNGSGKSTLTRILSRLYDPTSGEIIIDGLPSSDYRIADLHQATASLSQDSLIYPLSLAENIGLGYPEFVSDNKMIEEAAQEGGAAEFIAGLSKGYQTMLQSFDNSFHMNLNGDRAHPLWALSDKVQKTSDISGGQRQRVIAARTFMRFKSGKVKFVVVDEPSSALDADGELQLFERLIAARQGKTMVFVTHRFGHLTKYADQIICLKDGSVSETGTHEQLISANGEYAKLYNIQARAFSDTSPRVEVDTSGFL